MASKDWYVHFSMEDRDDDEDEGFIQDYLVPTSPTLPRAKATKKPPKSSLDKELEKLALLK